MKKMNYLLLVAVIACCVNAQVLFQAPKNDPNIVKALNEYFSGQKKLDVSTSCSVVDLPEHNGVTRSGYLNVGIKDSNSALGFIFYGALGVAAEDLKYRPTIVWLNGGPGCSSQFGNFYEIGPMYLNQTLSGEFEFTQNMNSWSNEFNTIFIDQPIGTGISYAESSNDIPTDMETIVKQFIYGLNELYHSPEGCFNQLGLNAKETPMFIYGEAYGGKYSSAIGAGIIKQGNQFNLKGIGIGDGFIDPYHTISSIPGDCYYLGLTNTMQREENDYY